MVYLVLLETNSWLGQILLNSGALLHQVHSRPPDHDQLVVNIHLWLADFRSSNVFI